MTDWACHTVHHTHLSKVIVHFIYVLQWEWSLANFVKDSCLIIIVSFPWWYKNAFVRLHTWGAWFAFWGMLVSWYFMSLQAVRAQRRGTLSTRQTNEADRHFFTNTHQAHTFFMCIHLFFKSTIEFHMPNMDKSVCIFFTIKRKKN